MFYHQYLRELISSIKYPNSPRLTGTTLEIHIHGAVDWIKKAHSMATDGGISKGYHIVRGQWSSGYPETTGYTIPTLLNSSASINAPELYSLALSLADYLLTVRTSEGAVGHWKNDKGYPVVFDTGQVIFGWLAAFDTSQNEKYLSSAIKAGKWLVSIQDTTGAWKDFQHLGVTKVIDTRVSWALLELHKRTGIASYKNVAINNLEWAIKQQMPDGWFRNCAFMEYEAPYTHTLAYTAEGLFESGIILNEIRYINAARLTADALLERQLPDGSLWGSYRQNWRKSSNSSCLTGNCQIACLWLQLYEQTQEEKYLTASKNAIDFVASTQHLDKSKPNIYGGIAGSYPIFGKYERFKYPNWAVKFFIDAILRYKDIEFKNNNLRYVG